MPAEKLHLQEANTVIRAMLRAGYSKTVVREVVGVSDTKIDRNYQQMFEAGMPPIPRSGSISARTLSRPGVRRQASIVLNIYRNMAAVRNDPATTTDSGVDLVALTRAHVLMKAALMDRGMEPPICINRLYRLAELLVDGSLMFEPDECGTPLLQAA